MTYTIYDSITGQILRNVVCAESMIDIQCADEEQFVPGIFDSGIAYVDPVKKTVLSRMDYALGAIPTPCTITIEGVHYNCTEQPVFEFDAPGIYKISVNAGAAYLEKEFEIDYQP